MYPKIKEKLKTIALDRNKISMQSRPNQFGKSYGNNLCADHKEDVALITHVAELPVNTVHSTSIPYCICRAVRRLNGKTPK